MVLYLIGIGLNDEKDISVKGLEIVKRCDYIYLESYTSILQVPVEDLEKLYGKKIIIADRDLMEKKAEETILKDAKENNVALLIIGDPLSATTHIDILLRAKEANIETHVIHNASILSAIGYTGLEVYKFGKITSIPFHHKDVKAPYEVLMNNIDKGLHTLFLLDLDPINNRFLSIQEAIGYLRGLGVTKDTKFVACARIGSDDPTIYYGTADELKDKDFGNPPYCIIIPAKLHFMEQEALERFEK